MTRIWSKTSHYWKSRLKPVKCIKVVRVSVIDRHDCDMHSRANFNARSTTFCTHRELCDEHWACLVEIGNAIKPDSRRRSTSLLDNLSTGTMLRRWSRAGGASCRRPDRPGRARPRASRRNRARVHRPAARQAAAGYSCFLHQFPERLLLRCCLQFGIYAAKYMSESD